MLIAIYAGGRRSELEGLRWERDMDLEGGWLQLPSTKTAQSRRKVRIPSALMSYLVAAEQDEGPVVEPWGNIGRDLAVACARAKIGRATPTICGGPSPPG